MSTVKVDKELLKRFKARCALLGVDMRARVEGFIRADLEEASKGKEG